MLSYHCHYASPCPCGATSLRYAEVSSVPMIRYRVAGWELDFYLRPRSNSPFSPLRSHSPCWLMNLNNLDYLPHLRTKERLFCAYQTCSGLILTVSVAKDIGLRVKHSKVGPLWSSDLKPKTLKDRRRAFGVKRHVSIKLTIRCLMLEDLFNCIAPSESMCLG